MFSPRTTHTHSSLLMLVLISLALGGGNESVVAANASSSLAIGSKKKTYPGLLVRGGVLRYSLSESKGLASNDLSPLYISFSCKQYVEWLYFLVGRRGAGL